MRASRERWVVVWGERSPHTQPGCKVSFRLKKKAEGRVHRRLWLWDAGLISLFSAEKEWPAGFLCHWGIQNHVCPRPPWSLCFLACVSESRPWSMCKFYIKALIVYFLFPSGMSFCPKEVQSFQQVSWEDTLVVSVRHWNSDTVHALLCFWKCACILSFKTLQSAWGKHWMISSITKNYQTQQKKDFSSFVSWGSVGSSGSHLWY